MILPYALKFFRYHDFKSMASKTRFKKYKFSEIEYCSPNPCQNSGQCENAPTGGFRCRCTTRYTGRLCQRSMLRVDQPLAHSLIPDRHQYNINIEQGSQFFGQYLR